MSIVAPLKSTASIFDESVLKVEFLPMPVQFTDFSLNLNTEAMAYRIKMIMDKIIGPIRVEGMNIYMGEDGSQHPIVCVDPGLLMFGPYFVRVATQQTFSFPSATRVLYARVTVSLLTNVSDPTIVNVNPPLAPSSLPGPNQYRYTVSLVLDTTLPSDTSSVFCCKLCDISGGGIITNKIPLLAAKLGSMDFSDVADTSYTSKFGTRAASFVVGYGTLNGGAGYKVVLDDQDAPAMPLNFRIVDVDDGSVKYGQSELLSNLTLGAKRGVNGHDCRVELRWKNDAPAPTVIFIYVVGNNQ